MNLFKCLHSFDLILHGSIGIYWFLLAFPVEWGGIYIFIIFSNNDLLDFSFFFRFILILCVWEGQFMWVQMPLEARERVRFGARVTTVHCGCWEPSSLSHLSNADPLHSLAILLCPVLFIILSVWIFFYYFWLFWIQICWSCSSLQKTSSLLLWFLILFFYSPFHCFLPKCLLFFSISCFWICLI